MLRCTVPIRITIYNREGDAVFTLEEVLSKRNQAQAFEYLAQKKDSCGADGMYLSELKEYWELNKERIMEALKDGSYSPGVVKNYEIINGKGKRRVISKLNTIDRFVTRLLSQKFSRYVEPTFFIYIRKVRLFLTAQ